MSKEQIKEKEVVEEEPAAEKEVVEELTPAIEKKIKQREEELSDYVKEKEVVEEEPAEVVEEKKSLFWKIVPFVLLAGGGIFFFLGLKGGVKSPNIDKTGEKDGIAE